MKHFFLSDAANILLSLELTNATINIIMLILLFRMAAANKVSKLIVGKGGFLSTPAVSNLIRYSSLPSFSHRPLNWGPVLMGCKKFGDQGTKPVLNLRDGKINISTHSTELPEIISSITPSPYKSRGLLYFGTLNLKYIC